MLGWLAGDPDTRFLDLACGCGDMLYVLERRGIAGTTGVDLCREELDNARLFVHGKLVHEDVLEFLHSEPEETTAFITAPSFLGHCPKVTLAALLTRLTPGLHPVPARARNEAC